MTWYGRVGSSGSHGQPGLSRAMAVAASSTLLNDLVAYWKLDEESGVRADALGAADLTDNNTVLFSAGKIGNAATFVSTNSEYLSHATVPAFSGHQDFTVSIWVNLAAAIADGILGRWAGGDRGWRAHTAASRVQFTVRAADNSGQTNLLADANYTASTWTHFVFTHDASADTINIVRDNNSPASTGHATGVRLPAKQFEIGGINGSAYLDGSVDMVGLWSRVLTADEITELYNSGTGLDHPFSG